MSKTFFFSDTHFNHKNVIKYEPIRVKYVAEFMVKKGKFRTYDEAVEFINSAYDSEDKDNIKVVLYYHDEMIIHRWNQKVKGSDTVWFLGDWVLGSKTYLSSCIKRLNGDIRMIKGNHDNFPNQWYLDNGVKYCSKYPVVLKGRFIAGHYPPIEYVFDDDGNVIKVIDHRLEDNFHIYAFGHVHSNENFETVTKNSRCFCCERQEMEPIEWDVYNKYNSIENWNI